MDKSELKKIIKPLIKECIREVLMEQGFMKLVAESAVRQETALLKQEIKTEKKLTQNPINENQKLMLQEIGRSGYLNNRFDPFSGTQALTEAQAAGNSAASVGPMTNIDPNDPGVDISNLMNGNKNVWKALVGGKGK